jgi:glucuronosyltransferase
VTHLVCNGAYPGHKNIRLFLTHGGLLSTLEAAYHGVPLIGIPLVFDQNGNMLQAERKGFAKPLEFMGLTEETLESSIHEMLNNSS